MNYTTQKSIRAAFWALHPELEQESRQRGVFSKGQNAQTCDCRSAFCHFGHSLERNGEISQDMANKVTL